jgi:hypothetical protein
MGVLSGRPLRVVIGFIIAPLVAAVVGSRLFPIVMNGDWRGEADLQLAAIIAASIVTVFGAMPVHIVLQQHARSGPLSYALAGAALGATPALLYLALSMPAIVVNHLPWSQPVGNLSRLAIVLSSAGSVSALVF